MRPQSGGDPSGDALGANHHHARIAELEREVAKTFTAAKELRNMAVANGQERDSARAALRKMVERCENPTLPLEQWAMKIPVTEARRVLDSKADQPTKREGP